MKLTLKQLRKLQTEGQLTDFALKDLPTYPNFYSQVGINELVAHEFELRK